MSQHYTYTAADFERYHSGKMSVQEMHDLEKAAMEDPFLAEALEGYVHSATPVKDVNELREKLFAKRKKKNVFFLTKQSAWTRIAAIFILIAGIGYLTLQLNSGNEKNELSGMQSIGSIKNTTPQPVTQPDSLIDEKEGLAVSTPGSKSSVSMKKENKLPEPDLQRSVTANEKPAEYMHDQNLQNAASPQLQNDSRVLNVLRGRVIDTLGNPVRYVTIRNKNKKIYTVSDSTGRFSLPAPDSLVMATISGVGYKTTEKKLNRNAEETIVMEPAIGVNETVVVTALGIRRSEKALGYANAKMKQAEMGAADSSSNTKELNLFNEYVRRNIKIPADKTGKNYKGTVILSFETNKKGTPEKIRVVQSLCDACDKEAIRLLRKGPKWTYTNSRHIVPIQF